MSTITEREADARRRKAFALFTRLSSIGMTADTVAHYDDKQWHAAALAAETRDPGPITRRIVVEMLAESERERALCPFCGMGDPEGEPGARKPPGHDGPCSQ